MSKLMKLSKAKTGADIPFLTPEVAPGSHCPMRLASSIAQTTEGMSSLIVGMQECATYSRFFNPNPEGPNGELHWLYVLDEKEIVFGARDGVINALKELDKAGAKAILIIATCVPDLIGEDFEGLIYELQPQIKAKLTFVLLGQFKNISYPPGSWKTMEAMFMFMEEVPIDEDTVNILGKVENDDVLPNPAIVEYSCMGHMLYSGVVLDRAGVFRGADCYSTHLSESDIGYGDTSRLKTSKFLEKKLGQKQHFGRPYGVVLGIIMTKIYRILMKVTGCLM